MRKYPLFASTELKLGSDILARLRSTGFVCLEAGEMPVRIVKRNYSNDTWEIKDDYSSTKPEKITDEDLLRLIIEYVEAEIVAQESRFKGTNTLYMGFTAKYPH